MVNQIDEDVRPARRPDAPPRRSSCCPPGRCGPASLADQLGASVRRWPAPARVAYGRTGRCRVRRERRPRAHLSPAGRPTHRPASVAGSDAGVLGTCSSARSRSMRRATDEVSVGQCRRRAGTGRGVRRIRTTRSTPGTTSTNSRCRLHAYRRDPVRAARGRAAARRVRRGDRRGPEMGRVTAWEPGACWRSPTTATRSRGAVEASEYGTRVTVEHRGLDQLPSDVAEHVRRYGWILLIACIATFPYSARRISRDISGSHPRTCTTRTPAPPSTGLHRVFGFGPDQRMAEDGVVQEAEIAVGPARVMMSGRAAREGEGAGNAADRPRRRRRCLAQTGDRRRRRGDPAQGRGLRPAHVQRHRPVGLPVVLLAERRCLLTAIVVRTPPHTVRPNQQPVADQLSRRTRSALLCATFSLSSGESGRGAHELDRRPARLVRVVDRENITLSRRWSRSRRSARRARTRRTS